MEGCDTHTNLCGDDGRDCEGSEGCVGRRAETAREEGLCGEDVRDCQGGRVVWRG